MNQATATTKIMTRPLVDNTKLEKEVSKKTSIAGRGGASVVVLALSVLVTASLAQLHEQQRSARHVAQWLWDSSLMHLSQPRFSSKYSWYKTNTAGNNVMIYMKSVKHASTAVKHANTAKHASTK